MGFCHPKEEFRFVELCFVSNGNQFLVYFCVGVCCTFAILNLNIFDCRLEFCGLEIRVGRNMVWIVNRNIGILERSGKASLHKRKSDRNEKTSRHNRKKLIVRSWEASHQKPESFSAETGKLLDIIWKASQQWLVACCQKFENKNVMWNAFNFHFELLESFFVKNWKISRKKSKICSTEALLSYRDLFHKSSRLMWIICSHCQSK